MAFRQHDLTIVAPLKPRTRDPLDQFLLDNMGYQRADRPYNARLKEISELHFLSFFTFLPPDDSGNREGYLVLEASFDGSPENFEKVLIKHFDEPLRRIFANCIGGESLLAFIMDEGKSLRAFMESHRYTAECFYVSCPGMARRQVEADRCLHAFLQEARDDLVSADAAGYLDFKSVVMRLQQAAKDEGLLSPPAPAIPTRVLAGPPLCWILGVLAPVMIVVLLVLAIGRWNSLSEMAQQPMFLVIVGLTVSALAYGLVAAGVGFLESGLLIIVLVTALAGAAAISQILPQSVFEVSRLVLAGLGILLGLVVLRFHDVEQAEQKEEKDIAPGWVDIPHMHDVCQDENAPTCMQNHFFNVSPVKPGIERNVAFSVRYLTLRTALWIVHYAGILFYNRGMLGGIPSIHFARWLILPHGKIFGNNDLLLFITNYDSSWDSYLGDFVDESSTGVSAIWSNTGNKLDPGKRNSGGFPRTWDVFFDGGSRFEKQFKAYARQGQFRTCGWFSAYPNVSVGEKISNAALRRALEKAKPDNNFALQDEILRPL
jgi:hypothetical protein